MLEAAELIGKADEDLGKGHLLLKAADGTVTRAFMGLGRSLAGDGDGSLRAVWPSDDVSEPCVEALGSGIDCRVGAVDGDASLGQMEEGGLLRVVVGDGLEAAKNEGVCAVLTRFRNMER